MTDEIKKILQLAHQEAERCDEPMNGHHLLLALVKSKSEVASFLIRHGIDLKQIRDNYPQKKVTFREFI